VLRYELQGVLGEGLGGSDGTGSGWSMELTEGLQWLRRSVLARGEGGMGFKGESAVGKGFVRAKAKPSLGMGRYDREGRRRAAAVAANDGWRCAVRWVGERRAAPTMGPLCVTHRNAQRDARSTGHWPASACGYGQVRRRADVRGAATSCARARVPG
jgi:hypothetical protein